MELGVYHGTFQQCLATAIPLSLIILLMVGYFGSPLWIWSLFAIALLYFWGAPLVALIVVRSEELV